MQESHAREGQVVRPGVARIGDGLFRAVLPVQCAEQLTASLQTIPIPPNYGYTSISVNVEGAGMRLRMKRIILPLVLGFCLSGCASLEPSALEPVSHESGSNRIRLSFLGRYSLGLFDIGAAKPAAYDPTSELLFVVSKDVGRIDFVDIGDPAAPKRIRREILLGAGGFPESIDVSHGILAVALSSPLKPLPGSVLFLDTEGQRIGEVVTVGVQPVQLRFTPSGRQILVANQGEPDGAYRIDPVGSIEMIDGMAFAGETMNLRRRCLRE